MPTQARKIASSVGVMLFLAVGGLVVSARSGSEKKSSAEVSIKDLHWTHFSIDAALPGTAWGTGGIGLADFDGDGDLDVVISRREPRTAYWFERKDDSTWVRHVVGRTAEKEETLGAAALDIDHDGWPDMVFSRVWFQNPGNLREHPDTLWLAHDFAGAGHDIIAADINGDVLPDIVVFNGKVLAWFDPSNNMKETVVWDGAEDHGGLAPQGVGDIDGDGDMDIVVPGYWFENRHQGSGTWWRHEWPYEPIPHASYGPSTRTWIADMNNDGLNDIVYSDCDTGNGHVYWVENTGKGAGWVRHQLPDPPTAAGDVPGTGSFHSLGVADFNRDGTSDIFAGEQEDPDTYMTAQGKLPMKPAGLKPRGVIWANSGGKNPTFTPTVIHVGWPGWHDVALGDVDGDGDIDIVSKIWNTDHPPYHADYWRNDLILRGR